MRQRSVFFFLLSMSPPRILFFFFFNDTATTEIYTLSLHDALPIFLIDGLPFASLFLHFLLFPSFLPFFTLSRSEEHTSELQSHLNLVCRLLLEKKKKISLPFPLFPSPAIDDALTTAYEHCVRHVLS